MAVAMTTIKIQKEQRQVQAVAVEQEFPLVLVVAVDLVELREVLVLLELRTLLVEVVVEVIMVMKHLVVLVEKEHQMEKQLAMVAMEQVEKDLVHQEEKKELMEQQ